IRDFHVTGVQTCALPIFAPDPVEQAPSQVLLERGDALAHRGLGQAQPFPGGGEAVALGHRDERLQSGQLHEVALVMGGMKNMNLSYSWQVPSIGLRSTGVPRSG